MLIKSDKYRSYIDETLNLLFLTAYLFIVGTFFLAKIFDSFYKQFWIDEIYGLGTARNFSYFHILFRGATGQASPAPLDFIACRILDQIKEKVSYFGFTPEVYFRLFANGITTFSALVMMFVFKKEITNSKNDITVKAAQLFLLLCLPITYLFQSQTYYFAAEMRPYALWNSLFMITLIASLSDRENKKFFFFSLVLLAFSATAVIFQLIAIAAAYFIVQLINKDNLKKIFGNEIKLLAIPFFIVLYYSLQVEKFNADVVSVGGTWEDFIKLWQHRSVIIPIMLLAITACFLKKENKKYAIAALAFLILFLMCPLIFLITRLRGYFYAERQFIYYDLSRAVFLLTLIKCMPAYVKNIRSRTIVSIILIIFCLIGASFALRPKFIRKFIKAETNALKVLTGDLVNSPDFQQHDKRIPGPS